MWDLKLGISLTSFFLYFRLERNHQREGLNLEYLKNVVLSYLISSEKSRQLHMLNAICMILQFTDGERDAVKKRNTVK